MRVCDACGVAYESPQCPACGHGRDESEVELELDDSYLVSRSSTTASEPREDSPSDGEPLPIRQPPRPRDIEPRAPRQSWDEEQRSQRELYWRATRIPVLVILGWFTASHLFFGAEWVFIDYVNLALHEAGHPMFSWGGNTLAALGGTLGQLLWPAAFAVYFLVKRRERFAGVACIWWFGENLPNIGRYMRDAVVQELPLVGGGNHDWAYLFGKWGMLSSCQPIGATFRVIGIVIMLATLGLLVWWTLRPSQRELEAKFDDA